MGGRGAKSSITQKIKINYSYDKPIIGKDLTTKQQKEVQDKATKYINSLKLKDGDINVVAGTYAYQDQVDVLVLPSTKKGTKGGTIQEARYQEMATIRVSNTTEEKKLLKNGFKKWQIGSSYLTYEKKIYGKKIS